MNLSLHCQKRQRQRGRNDIDISILAKYGEHYKGARLLTQRRANKIIIRLRRWIKRHSFLSDFQARVSQARKIVERLEKLINWMLIISPEGTVITVYPADKRRQKKFMRGECRPVDRG